MRWTPALIITLLVSLGLILLGMWLIFQGTDGAAAAGSGPAAISAPRQPAGNPAGVGFALLTGGVLLLVLAFRKV